MAFFSAVSLSQSSAGVIQRRPRGLANVLLLSTELYGRPKTDKRPARYNLKLAWDDKLAEASGLVEGSLVDILFDSESRQGLICLNTNGRRVVRNKDRLYVKVPFANGMPSALVPMVCKHELTTDGLLIHVPANASFDVNLREQPDPQSLLPVAAVARAETIEERVAKETDRIVSKKPLDAIWEYGIPVMIGREVLCRRTNKIAVINGFCPNNGLLVAFSDRPDVFMHPNYRLNYLAVSGAVIYATPALPDEPRA